MNKTYLILLLTIVIASKFTAHNNKELAHPFEYNDGFETAVATLLVHDNVTNDTTPTLTGTGGANAILTVSVDTNADGRAEVTYTTTANANGDWSVDPDKATPDSGTFTALSDNAVISVLVTAAGNGAVGTVRIDTSKPDVLNDATNDSTPTISGTAEPNEELTIEVDIGQNDIVDVIYTVIADAKGDWNVDPDTAIPTSGGPFTALSDGTVLEIRGSDEAGNFDKATIVIDLLVPTVTSETTANTRPVLTGRAEANEWLRVLVEYDSNKMGHEALIELVADANGNWRVDTAMTPTGGTFKTFSDNDVLTISATDRVGNSSKGTVRIDTSLPVVHNKVTNETKPIITGTATTTALTVTLDTNNDGTADLTYATTTDANGDWVVDTDAATPDSGTFPTALSDNTVIAVTATDAASKTGTGTVHIDTTAPTVEEKSTNVTTPILTGIAEANEALTVEVDTNDDGTIDVTYKITVDIPDIVWRINTGTAIPRFNPLVDDNRITVYVTDVAGNSGSGYVYIDTTAPTVEEKVTKDTTPTLTGRAETSEALTVDVDTSNNGTVDVIYTVTAAANGDWSIDTGAVTPDRGTFTALNDDDVIIVDARDAAGNGGSKSVRIDTTAPTVDTKTTNDITPTLTGKAEANEVLTVDVDTDNNGTADLSYTITVAANNAWSIDTGAVAPNNGVLFPTLRDKDIIGVTVTDAASNSGSGTVRIDTSALSVEDLEQKNRVYVYPNPVSETLNFSFGSKIPYHATVYDLSGKKRLSAELPQLSLDVSSLDKGVYFVVVEHTSGEKQTLKFIKENKP